MKKYFGLILASLLTALLVGCANTGYHPPAVTWSKYHQVRFDDHPDLYLQRYRPQIEQVFQRHGLQLTTNAVPEVLLCKADFKGGVSIRAHISLWDGQQMIVSGESFNGGWGTILASAAAMEGVVKGAIETLDREIGKLDGTQAMASKPLRMRATD